VIAIVVASVHHLISKTVAFQTASLPF